MRTGLVGMMNCLIFWRSHHQTIKTNSSSTEPITSAQKLGIYSFGNARTSSSIFVRHWRLTVCPVALAVRGWREERRWRMESRSVEFCTTDSAHTCCWPFWRASKHLLLLLMLWMERRGVASDQEPVWSALKATWLHLAPSPNASKMKN